jgi:hypothetical protein
MLGVVTLRRRIWARGDPKRIGEKKKTGAQGRTVVGMGAGPGRTTRSAEAWLNAANGSDGMVWTGEANQRSPTTDILRVA